jgi:hypothetical protein
MSNLKRIDSFYINYADSFARAGLKIKEMFIHADGKLAKKGVGEKRIYVGNDEVYYDSFFELDKNPRFFVMREDLQEYLAAVDEELKNPRYDFGADKESRDKIVSEYKGKLAALKADRVYLEFKKTFDKQQRYYLVLKPGEENRDNYNYVRDIALPRVTRLLFVKLYDEKHRRFFIYLKPVIMNINATEEELALARVKDFGEGSRPKRKSAGRDAAEQAKYRQEVVKRYPFCVITRVSDSELLEACHLKDYKECSRQEEFDPFNGVSMTPTMHRIYDLGDMTFTERGEVLFSDFLRNMDRKCLNLNRTIRVNIDSKSIPYVKWHSEHVFRRLASGALSLPA